MECYPCEILKVNVDLVCRVDQNFKSCLFFPASYLSHYAIIRTDTKIKLRSIGHKFILAITFCRMNLSI